jgi:transposase
MTKFTTADRLAAALAVEAGESVIGVSRLLGMSPQVVKRSADLYHEEGSAGFSEKKSGYTLEQKLEVLKYKRTHNVSCDETAILFGIRGSATVWEWERRYLENGIEGLTPKKKGRRPRVRKPKVPLTPHEQLLAENEYLRAENEYLKKLNALVAEREAREKRDKATE